MGKGGSSNQASSSSSTTTTNTSNESLNAAISGDIEEGGIALSGKHVSLTQVDPKALEFATTTINGVGGILSQVLDNQMQVYSGANDLVGNAMSNLAAASGVEPVEFGKKPLTQTQKLWLGAGGVASVSALAYALLRNKK